MAENKSAYVQKLKAQLDEFDAEIDKLVARSKQAEADAKVEADQALSDLREKRNKAQEQLDALRDSSDAAYDEMKTGVQAAWSSLTDAFDKARSKFS